MILIRQILERAQDVFNICILRIGKRRERARMRFQAAVEVSVDPCINLVGIERAWPLERRGEYRFRKSVETVRFTSG